MTVKFEKVSDYKDVDFNLPQRQTIASAGYDFEVPEDIVIPSHYLNLVSILLAKITEKETLEDISNIAIINQLIKIGEDAGALDSEQAKHRALYKLRKSLPPSILELKEILTLDLQDLKDLIKSTNTKVTLVPTGVKAYLKENQKLELFVRSSSAVGAYLLMGNSVGIVDSDYVDNESNEGHISFPIINLSPFNVRLKKGDVIGQGIISTYDKIDNDESNFVRLGGFGSTDEEQ